MDKIIDNIQGLIEEIITDSSLFLVDLYIKPTNNVKVFLDGDTGININTISRINKTLYKKLEDSDYFPNDDFSLEVSSPGIDKPLKHFRQYPKNIGRDVHIVLNDDSTLKGTLKEVNEKEIVVVQQFPKKKTDNEAKEINIPFENIKSTTIELKF